MSQDEQIHKDVQEQLKSLRLDPDRPLIITDADEVLFNFMVGLESYLEEEGLYFDWSSFALHGNIRRKDTQIPLEAEAIGHLINDFFDRQCHSLPAVEGAAEHLATLSNHAQIVVLSNVPPKYADKRRTSLIENGMDFPLIANVGPKGRVVKHMTDHVTRPAFFIDDIPHNHQSVSKHAAPVNRLHYIADPRLSALLGPAEHCHVRLESWPDIQTHIFSTLEKG
ncbi:hypothetical protein [Sneathiella chinensis]|uniref:HAD family hydrolase n=1 Tax=Sneathiella chinensis TaxID=349750 RepID=A0ABQ5U919_9PROT|nr:hypothetical protein [Sneathiella chinensis]GLQ07675.1 hypothetical protein GCM10007924_28960 [Sneathiella chinensis]